MNAVCIFSNIRLKSINQDNVLAWPRN